MQVWQKAQSSFSNDAVHREQDYWKNVFIKFALIKLSKRQKRILVEAYFNADGLTTLTSLARKIASKTNIPMSTVKWNLRLLRDLGLLIGGSIDRKNVPFKLSEAGRTLAKYIVGVEDSSR